MMGQIPPPPGANTLRRVCVLLAALFSMLAVVGCGLALTATPDPTEAFQTNVAVYETLVAEAPPTPTPPPSPLPPSDTLMLQQACQGAGLPEALPWQMGSGPHSVFFFFPDPDSLDDEYALEVASWKDHLPDGWVAGSIDEAEMLACLDLHIEEITQDCVYVNPDTGSEVTANLEMTRFNLTVQLLEARSGHVLTQDTIAGRRPTCPYFLSDAIAQSGNFSHPLEGRPVRVDQVETWLEPYVTGS
jgi:hypothetical protein